MIFAARFKDFSENKPRAEELFRSSKNSSRNSSWTLSIDELLEVGFLISCLVSTEFNEVSLHVFCKGFKVLKIFVV